MDIAHRPRRQATSAVATPAGQKPGVEGVEVSSRQVDDANATQDRHDVGEQLPPVGLDGAGRAAQGGQPLTPALEPPGKSDLGRFNEGAVPSAHPEPVEGLLRRAPRLEPSPASLAARSVQTGAEITDERPGAGALVLARSSVTGHGLSFFVFRPR